MLPHPAVPLMQSFHKKLSCLVHGKQVALLLEARALWSSRNQAVHDTRSSDTSQQAHVENWYPGHMQKAVRDMQGRRGVVERLRVGKSRLKQVDLVLEVRDARQGGASAVCVLSGVMLHHFLEPHRGSFRESAAAVVKQKRNCKAPG
eukprot:1161773-Pelagomonas_calceolata.AAC.11